ncbi:MULTISPECIES: hypothetical protein [Xanthomonas]|uniref:Uncharacterized protein n=1 Tax=Xanthomonas hortorum pv. gardneri TaxID=2754056 RepID=A0A6V7FLL1_9XANT|nr:MULTISPECIES: hypothetical protein [Xanthomonas]APO97892.1 hypothetical protein BJD13_01545 [Xanthomonas perforans]APP82797.1 hypothetical protein BJD10_24275 [Xanthomonas hortorum pv. gardneri]KLA99298.1 hypothetical protein SM19410_06775 [Xanthomonas hortorum pv. gardneri]KLB02840.1 hypothetical protein SM17710_02790 [Xanthomonas hortorum pv. gardneri]KLB06075.1 hypothetical protein SM18210_01915 [Xanthomonas hortorum pv. gardneri]
MNTPEKSLGYRIGETLYAMSQWSRPARASIVIVGMLAAIVFFWLSLPAAAVAIGFLSLAMFWLLLPTDTPADNDTAANDTAANDTAANDPER